MSFLWLDEPRTPKTYHEALELLCELIGLHPKRRTDEDWCEMLKRAGWRPFRVERVSR